MDAETKKSVILILIGAGIGLLPTWINFTVNAWVSGIRRKTGIIRKFKFALSTYLLETEVLRNKVPLPTNPFAPKYLMETYEDFLNNAGLFNKYEMFYFFWVTNLIIGTEKIRETTLKILKDQPTWSQILSNQTQEVNGLTTSIIKLTYEFLCFDESPFWRRFVWIWHRIKKRNLNTKAIDEFMKKI